ncbi:MAG: CoA transferase [Alphaproteobacteria bacterium]
MTGQALDGLRVLDFSRIMAGPHASVVLSDFGADVIKIESLPHGDLSRHLGTEYEDTESAFYLMWNRGKRSIALDLRKPEAIAIIHRLARDADIVIENYRPGVADKIGIGYEDLSRINPRIVYCSVSGFGQTGPLAGDPATDTVVQGMAGIMTTTGERGGAPVLVGVPVIDYSGASLAVQGIMFALHARHKTGHGQKVDISLMFSIMPALSTRLATFWASGKEPERFGSTHPSVLPYQAFKTADGWVMAGISRDEDWPRFCAAIERDDLAADPRYATNRDRLERRDELIAKIDAAFPRRTTAEWAERFRKAGTLFGPILTFTELFNHPHVQSSGIVQDVPHPTLGTVKQLGPVIQMSKTPGRIQAAPPLLGQHTAEVLRQAGYSDTEIAAFAASGAIALPDAREA